MLLKNRRKPVAVAARAIVRAGVGHKYWSTFPADSQEKVEKVARELYELLFDPEIKQPIKTLDLPIGGSVSPLDALSLLVDFLLVSDQSIEGMKAIGDYVDDVDGTETINILRRGILTIRRVTGNEAASLGLHPAVYFYNEKGKHSRFLFLGMIDLVAKKLRNNDSGFFKRFTQARSILELVLLQNKSLIGILLQNTGKGVRVTRMREMFEFLVDEISAGREVTPEGLIARLGGKGRVFDITTGGTSSGFSEDAKSTIYLSSAMSSAAKCPECDGWLFPLKSASYDHVVRVREGGTGAAENGQLMHPYCNTAMKG